MKKKTYRKKEFAPPPRADRRITKEDLTYLIEIQRTLSPFWASRNSVRVMPKAA